MFDELANGAIQRTGRFSTRAHFPLEDSRRKTLMNEKAAGAVRERFLSIGIIRCFERNGSTRFALGKSTIGWNNPIPA